MLLAALLLAPLIQDPVAVPAWRAPRAGEVRATTFEETTRLRVVRHASSMAGDERVREDFHPVTTSAARRAWTDRWAAREGRDPELERQVTEARRAVTLELGEGGRAKVGRAAQVHPVQGHRVRFEVPEEVGAAPEARDAERPGDAARAPWEDQVVPGPDGRGLLPPADRTTLRTGEVWDVPPSALAELLSPGGFGAEHLPGMEGLDDPDLFARYGQLSLALATGAVEGTVRATWKGVVQDPGEPRLGRWDLALDVACTGDTTAWMQAQSAPFARALIGQGARDARLEMALEGTAHVLWNMDAGRLAEFTLEADVAAHFTQDFAFDFGGTPIDGDYDIALEGTTRVVLVARPAPDEGDR